MPLPKQQANESDADYATRLEKARERHKEHVRKYDQANREKKKEYYEANKEKMKDRTRKYYEKKVLASAKGKPLRSNYTRVKRPQILTRLILKHAEGLCLKYGFPLDQMFDTDVLVCAARTIRDSLELDGTENPWYRSDYLHESLINDRRWGSNFRKTWCNKI